MNGEIIGKALEPQLRQHVETMAASAQANAIPLPGALKDAFATAPEIRVDKYFVRPFYDADFEFLQELNHPLHEVMIASQAKGDVDTSKHKRSSAWELFYIFTKDVDFIDDLFQRGPDGIAELRKNARAEFKKIQGPLFLALDNAIGEQIKRYWSPCIQYGEDGAANGEVAISTRNFPDTEAKPAMASVG